MTGTKGVTRRFPGSFLARNVAKSQPQGLKPLSLGLFDTTEVVPFPKGYGTCSLSSGGRPRPVCESTTEMRGTWNGNVRIPRKAVLSLRIREVPAAVLLPAGFVGLGAERLLLAVADGLDP